MPYYAIHAVKIGGDDLPPGACLDGRGLSEDDLADLAEDGVCERFDIDDEVEEPKKRRGRKPKMPPVTAEPDDQAE